MAAAPTIACDVLPPPNWSRRKWASWRPSRLAHDRGRRRVAHAVAGHAVDVVEREAGVVDRSGDRVQREGERAHARVLRVRRGTHAHDRGAVTERVIAHRTPSAPRIGKRERGHRDRALVERGERQQAEIPRPRRAAARRRVRARTSTLRSTTAESRIAERRCREIGELGDQRLDSSGAVPVVRGRR